MRNFTIIALMAIASMAVMASCNNKKQTELEQKHVYSCNEYFSWSEDTVFIVSESGEKVSQCALNEIQGENELFSNDKYTCIGLNDYFITDDLGNPLMPYSPSEYDSCEHKDIYSSDTLKIWFIPSIAGYIDTVYCTFGRYERKSLVYNIVRYYALHQHTTITNPDNIRFYCGSGVATIKLGNNIYEYPFKDQWISVIEHDHDRDVILLAYGLKVSSFSFDEITVIETAPRWVIPLDNRDEIRSWYDEPYQPESYRRTYFACYEYEKPELYSVDVINEKIYDVDGNEVSIENIIKG